MPALAQSFDPNAYEPNIGFDVITPGLVRAMIMKTGIEHVKGGNAIVTSDGTSNKQQLSIEFEVQGGSSQGRKFWDRIWVMHPEEKAMNFGNGRMSALCHAFGYLKPLVNSDVLHGKTGEVELDVEPAGKDEKTGKSYSAKNVVKKYIVPGEAKATNGSLLAQAQIATAAIAAKPPGKKKAWED